MNDLTKVIYYGRLTSAAILGLAAIVLAANIQKFFWAGLALGVSTGYLNLEILYRRAEKCINENNTTKAVGIMRRGSNLRFLTATVGALAAIKFRLSLIGFLMGLVAPQLIIAVLYAAQNNSKGKG